MVFTHRSVMPGEVLEFLNLKPGDTCVDGTLGGSGHARGILETVLPGGRLIGVDQDIDAIENARRVFKSHGDNVDIIHDNYASLPLILKSLGIAGVDGILLDLGLSFHQLMESRRGFSFQKDEPLDMRMDIRNGHTAADIVNTYGERELADLFFTYGEERHSRKIARVLVRKREDAPITTSRNLAEIVRKAVPVRKKGARKIHPATRVFQALRIKVNRELDVLETFLEKVPDFLNRGGRLCVISFHSLEDRLVKQALKRFEDGCTCPRDFPKCVCGFVPTMRTVGNKKSLVATPEEVAGNPMARSARLRVGERI